jgi:asparagine synthase (glutamine-hydrolysing)
MANGIELRLPLVDYRLVETVMGLRKGSSDWRLPPKAWLKAAVEDVLPPWVMNRQKRGFAPPIREWLAALFEEYGSRLPNGELVKRGVLSRSAAESWSRCVWTDGVVFPIAFNALVLEVWCEEMTRWMSA